MLKIFKGIIFLKITALEFSEYNFFHELDKKNHTGTESEFLAQFS